MPIFGVSERKSLAHERQITLNLTLHNVPFFTLHNVKVGTFLRSWNVNPDSQIAQKECNLNVTFRIFYINFTKRFCFFFHVAGH